jgi:TRAP-type C4-dicarboxylate transport system permease small subunit
VTGVGLDRPGQARPEPASTSRRPVRAIALLLMLEAAGIVAYGAYELSRVDWRSVIAAREVPSGEVVVTLRLVMFAPAVVLTLLASLGFLLLRRRGWLLAAISQGAVVATGLWLYVAYEPVYVYPIMAYAVLIILYLNVHDVRAVFYPGDRKRGPRRLA